MNIITYSNNGQAHYVQTPYYISHGGNHPGYVMTHPNGAQQYNHQNQQQSKTTYYGPIQDRNNQQEFHNYGGIPTYVIVPESMPYHHPNHPTMSCQPLDVKGNGYGNYSRKSSLSSQGYQTGSNYSNTSTRNNSRSESVTSNEEKSKIHRCHSGDSGIASSTVFTSDDDTDNIKSIDYESLEENIWTVENDREYWILQNRSPPSNFACANIVKQLEFYMCDEYLSKDKYLLRQIRCKKGGYVSIKLLASFKKLKKLATDWESLRSAVTRKSTQLIVSEEGCRIRRIVPLSDELLKPRMLTSVLAIRLPQQYNSVDMVTSLFRIFGEIGLVRLLRSGKPIPTDLRNYATQVPDIGTSLCAVVEFESSSAAMAAVRVIKARERGTIEDEYTTSENVANEENFEEYFEKIKNLPELEDTRLALLGPRVRRTLYRQDREKNKEPNENSVSVPTEVKLRLSDAKSTANTSPSKRCPNTPPNVIRMPNGPTHGHDVTKCWKRKLVLTC